MRTQVTKAAFERKVWSECRNGEEGWGKFASNGRARLARFARENYTKLTEIHAFGKGKNNCFAVYLSG